MKIATHFINLNVNLDSINVGLLVEKKPFPNR